MTPHIPADEQIAELERERRLRDRVYPRLIEAKKLKQATADRNNAALDAATRSLKWLRDNRGWIEAAFAEMLEADRKARAAVADAADDLPSIAELRAQAAAMSAGAAAILDAFPDGDVVDVRRLERAT